VTDPIPMLLYCPECGMRHVDRGEFATKPHYTHACQGCGHVWRPAIVATVGVQFLPGFKDEESPAVLVSVRAALDVMAGVVMWGGRPMREGKCEGPQLCLACERLGSHLEPA